MRARVVPHGSTAAIEAAAGPVRTSSPKALKPKQLAHEESTRVAGGVSVRNRETGNLVEVPSVSRVVRRP